MDIFKKKSWCPSGVLESLVGKAADWQQCTADCTERIGKVLYQNVVIVNYGDQVRRYFALEYDCSTCTESCLSICPLRLNMIAAHVLKAAYFSDRSLPSRGFDSSNPKA